MFSSFLSVCLLLRIWNFVRRVFSSLFLLFSFFLDEAPVQLSFISSLFNVVFIASTVISYCLKVFLYTDHVCFLSVKNYWTLRMLYSVRSCLRRPFQREKESVRNLLISKWTRTILNLYIFWELLPVYVERIKLGEGGISSRAICLFERAVPRSHFTLTS